MRLSRGFVYYDLWILAVALAVIAGVIVPSVLRGVRKHRLRLAERTDLLRIADAERAHHQHYRVYLDSLSFGLADGTRLLTLRVDSEGWSASVTSDSLQGTPLTCGVFEGPVALAPNPAVTTPGQIACW